MVKEQKQKSYVRGNDAKSNTVVAPANFIRVNLTNKKFNKLLVLNPLGKNIKRNVVWRCMCDCGILTLAASNDLLSSRKGSCGCITINRIINDRKQRAIPVEEIAKRRIFYNYKKGAIKRGIDFCLTEEDIWKFCQYNCIYCNSKPKNKLYIKNEIVFYNGIDRMENNKGYVLSNCGPCCGECNMMKRGMDYRDFALKIMLICKNIVKD